MRTAASYDRIVMEALAKEAWRIKVCMRAAFLARRLNEWLDGSAAAAAAVDGKVELQSAVGGPRRCCVEVWQVGPAKLALDQCDAVTAPDAGAHYPPD